MKKISLVCTAAVLVLFTACGNTEEVTTEQVPVATVEPEIGPAQEMGAKIDAAADSVKADVKQSKEELAQAADTAKKNLKTTAEKVKTETNKAATEVKNAAVRASEAVKKESNKAAEEVKKAAKDLKNDLKRK